MTPGFAFRVLATDGRARAGILDTPHGEVPTPTFMPVGTQATVKGLLPVEVAATGARVVLANTYHLWLRPGPDVVAAHGGLHGFCRWPHAMLTDSGGYQAFSLADLRTTSDEGFVFRSHLDGSRRLLGPEEAMRVQGLLGADVAMQLDVCPPGKAPRDEVERAVDRTTRWARRCLRAARRDRALFGIVQGGVHEDLRAAHAADLGALREDGRALDGLALGGFSVGEPPESMHRTIARVAPLLDPARPRYLMGVGTPADLVRAIGAGVDMFDCVLPTRNARNGMAFVRGGTVVLKHARWRDDRAPIDPACGCPACAGGHSRAYLRHLVLAGEMLGARLLTLHNLQLYGALVAGAREAIAAGAFEAFARAWAG